MQIVMVDMNQIVSDLSRVLSVIDPISMALGISWMGMLFCFGGMVIVIRQIVILRKLYESRLSKVSHLIVALTKAMESRERSFNTSIDNFVQSTAQITEISEDLSQSVVHLSAVLRESDGL